MWYPSPCECIRIHSDCQDVGGIPRSLLAACRDRLCRIAGLGAYRGSSKPCESRVGSSERHLCVRMQLFVARRAVGTARWCDDRHSCGLVCTCLSTEPGRSARHATRDKHCGRCLDARLQRRCVLQSFAGGLRRHDVADGGSHEGDRSGDPHRPRDPQVGQRERGALPVERVGSPRAEHGGEHRFTGVIRGGEVGQHDVPTFGGVPLASPQEEVRHGDPRPVLRDAYRSSGTATSAFWVFGARYVIAALVTWKV